MKTYRLEYKIFKMVRPEVLSKTVQEGYGYISTIKRSVLEEPKESFLYESFDTELEALVALARNYEKLETYQDYTVLPIVNVKDF